MKEKKKAQPSLQYGVYRKYMILFYFGVSMMLFAVGLGVVSVQPNVDVPSRLFGMLVISSLFGGMAICIFVWIRFLGLRFKGVQMFDERQKSNRNRAVFYGMTLTIILSTCLIYIIDYLGIELSTRTLIMMPLVILSVSSGIFFQFFNKKGDAE